MVYEEYIVLVVIKTNKEYKAIEECKAYKVLMIFKPIYPHKMLKTINP